MAGRGHIGDDELTPQRRKFVEAYTGNGKEAAIAAGCTEKSAGVTASRWLDDPRIIDALDARDAKAARPIIRSRLKRQEWLADIVEDPNAELPNRLKAMEMLKRSCGDFLDRVDVNHRHTIELPDVDAETMRLWARKTLPRVEEEEAEVVGPH